MKTTGAQMFNVEGKCGKLEHGGTCGLIHLHASALTGKGKDISLWTEDNGCGRQI